MEDWLTTNQTFMVVKDKIKATPDNFCPNICLSTTFKLCSKMIASNMYLVSKSLYCIRRNLKVLHVQKINC
ncbi:hypothetical protein NXF25_002337 [Crotalus adamanteus]|uniref:Uncharacterized protein n=1 Tax=Crotalus adamanteus TaxID=8729 RepID=A0AAW1CBL3_CROAD